MSESVVPGRPKRRTLVAIVVGVLVVVAVVAIALWNGRGGEDPPGSAVTETSSPTSGPSSSSSPTDAEDGTAEPSPSGSAGSSSDDPADGSTATDEAAPGGKGTTYTEDELPPVAPDETAEGTDGVTAELSKVEQVTGEAVAAGEVSGPAVRLTVRLTNGTDQPLDLSYVAVNAYVGPDRTPASTFVSPGAKPFGGVLEPGESGGGVVLFAMTEEESSDVTVTVDYGADVPALAFQGAFEG